MSPVCSTNAGRPRHHVQPVGSQLQCGGDVLVGFLAEADMAVADLREERFRSFAHGVIVASELSAYDFGTPPTGAQITPVPAQAMPLRNPLRSAPSSVWSCSI